MPTITPFYVGISAVLLVILTLYIVVLRNMLKVGMGDGGQPILMRAVRAHGNFTEFTPLLLVMLLLLELGGATPGFVQEMGIAIVLGRVLHAIGLAISSGRTVPRALGVVITIAALLTGAWNLIAMGAKPF